MADTGPFLTSCIVFYLSIGAAIFQILEEPNWKTSRDRYILQKENILHKYGCLSKQDLDDILEIVSEAAGQGVTITGEIHRNTWDWANSVIFASTIVTTIGFGNVAPKTKGGRVFCILYGLCGIPLCLVWISQLGSFFGDRAKRLSQIMFRKGISVKKVQFTCTALFLLWGLFVHLVIPPFVFMSMEQWSYLDGLYYSFITLTTVGFGDFVAGVNPNIEYPRLYRVFAELWIYMGLAWLSLFFSWNVHMVVEAHKVLRRKRRHKHRHPYEDEPEPSEEKSKSDEQPSIIDIFNFPEDEDYSTIIKNMAPRRQSLDINRSKSCSDIQGTNIQTLERSPRHRRMISISEVFMNAKADADKREEEKGDAGVQPGNADPEPAQCLGSDKDQKESCGSDSDGITFTVPTTDPPQEKCAPQTEGGGNRFTISKVVEEDLLIDKDEKG